MRTAVSYAILVLSVFIFASCSKINNPVTVQESHNQLDKANFVIDNMAYTINMRRESDGSYVHYLNYKISYHFTNASGSLNSLGISPSGSTAYMMIMDFPAPTEMNKNVSYESNYSLGKKFNKGDILNIRLSFAGAFWTKQGSSYVPGKEFDMNKDIRVTVE